MENSKLILQFNGDICDYNVNSLIFKGVKKMVVVENLLYVLDTEVSFMIPPVDAVSDTTE